MNQDLMSFGLKQLSWTTVFSFIHGICNEVAVMSPFGHRGKAADGNFEFKFDVNIWCKVHYCVIL